MQMGPIAVVLDKEGFHLLALVCIEIGDRTLILNPLAHHLVQLFQSLLTHLRPAFAFNRTQAVLIQHSHQNRPGIECKQLDLKRQGRNEAAVVQHSQVPGIHDNILACKSSEYIPGHQAMIGTNELLAVDNFFEALSFRLKPGEIHSPDSQVVVLHVPEVPAVAGFWGIGGNIPSPGSPEHPVDPSLGTENANPPFGDTPLFCCFLGTYVHLHLTTAIPTLV